MKNKVLILILFSLSLSPVFSNINEPENTLFENQNQVVKTDVILYTSAKMTNVFIWMAAPVKAKGICPYFKTPKYNARRA